MQRLRPRLELVLTSRDAFVDEAQRYYGEDFDSTETLAAPPSAMHRTLWMTIRCALGDLVQGCVLDVQN